MPPPQVAPSAGAKALVRSLEADSDDGEQAALWAALLGTRPTATTENHRSPLGDRSDALPLGLSGPDLTDALFAAAQVPAANGPSPGVSPDHARSAETAGPAAPLSPTAGPATSGGGTAISGPVTPSLAALAASQSAQAGMAPSPAQGNSPALKSGGGAQIEDLVFDGPAGPGIVVTSGVTVNEGTAGSLTLALATAPTSTVTVNVEGDALYLSTPTAPLTFTPSNWSVPQVVNFTSLPNGTVEGYHHAAIQTWTSASADPDYNEINGASCIVSILDDDGPNAVTDTAETTAGTALPAINVRNNDVDLRGYGLNVTSHTQGADGGTVTLNADQTFAYTPPSNYFGVDNFSYTLTASNGQTTTGAVLVHVAPINHAPALPSINARTDAEDAEIDFTVPASDVDGDQVYFTATNLPLGLAIDRLTGQITGRVAANAANPVPYQPPGSSHIYNVTIDIDDGRGLTASRSFDWTTTHTNHAPWIEPAGAFAGAAGWFINKPMLAHDDDVTTGMVIDQLSFSAAGLPPGVSISTTNGTISGTLMPNAVGVYNPVVTVSDGHTTGSQSFTLTILPYGYSFPSASIWINGTAGTSDDLTQDGVSVPATIVGTAGAAVTLGITGPAALSTSSVVLDSTGQATVQIIPTADSTAADDIKVSATVVATKPGFAGIQTKVDEKALANVRVTSTAINREIERYTALPAGSKTHALTRIPPRIDTTIRVELSIDLSKSTKGVVLSRDGNSAANGDFRINGGTTATLKQQVNQVRLRGETMTTVGNHGKLRMVMTAGTAVKHSPFFSVSALPIKFRLADTVRNGLPKAIDQNMNFRDGTRKAVKVGPWSVGVMYYWDSDSGVLADLDKVWIGEFVTRLDGIAANTEPWNLMAAVQANSSYVLPRPRDKYEGQIGSFFDNFLPLPGKYTKEDGTFRTDQWYGIRDGRSESVDKDNMTHDYQNDIAYFRSTRRIFKDTDNKWYYEYDRVRAGGPPVQHEPANLPYRAAEIT